MFFSFVKSLPAVACRLLCWCTCRTRTYWCIFEGRRGGICLSPTRLSMSGFRLKIPQLAVFASAFVRERDCFAQYGPKYAVADTDEEQCFYFSPGDGWHDRAALCVCMWVSACCVSVDFVQRLCARLVLLVHGSVGWDSDDPTWSRLAFSFVCTLTVPRRDRRGSQVRPKSVRCFYSFRADDMGGRTKLLADRVRWTRLMCNFTGFTCCCWRGWGSV